MLNISPTTKHSMPSFRIRCTYLKKPEKMSERQKQKDSRIDRRTCKARLPAVPTSLYIQITFSLGSVR